MTVFSQKYTIVQLLEDMPVGMEFRVGEWPLHTTVVDIFAVDWDVVTLQARLADFLARSRPFATRALHDERFGKDRETLVTLLERTPELLQLHQDIFALLCEGGLRPNNPEFAGEGFKPHATVQSHARLQEDDIVDYQALTIIDMFPGGDPHKRRIVATIPFGE